MNRQTKLFERLANCGFAKDDPFPMPPVKEYGLTPHPFDDAETSETLCVLSPWVEGVSLLEVTRRLIDGVPHAMLTWREAMEILALLAEAVACLQSTPAGGLVHQDIKPSNIILSREPRSLCKGGCWNGASSSGACLALIDYDTAVFLDDCEDDAPCGSFGYTSPEGVLYGGRAANRAMDVYSFGVVACELLGGRWPHPFAKHWFSERADWQDWYRSDRCREGLPLMDLHIPGRLGEVVLSCLDLNPERRPSPAALARAVADASHSGGAFPARGLPKGRVERGQVASSLHRPVQPVLGMREHGEVPTCAPPLCDEVKTLVLSGLEEVS